MAEDRQIDAISIGIGANLSNLKQTLDEAQRMISGFKFKAPPRTEIPVTAIFNDKVARAKLDTLTKGEREIRVRAVLVPTQTSMKDFRQLLRDQLAKGNDFVIPFKADLKSARAIKQSIQEAITGAGPVTIQVAWAWAQGGPPPTGGMGNPPESAPGGKPRKPPKTPTSGGGGGATTVVTPTQPPQEPVHQAPRVITRPARPVKAKATSPVAAVGTTPESPIYPGLVKQVYNRPGGGTMTGNVELSPGVGAPRAQGTAPGLDQRLKRAIARTMRTGDPSDIYSILGPFQELTQTLGKYEGYNLPGAGDTQVNLRKLIDEALGFSQTRRGRGKTPLREWEEFIPKEAKFRPETLARAAEIGDLNYDFVQRARGRAASTGGVYSDIDVHIASQRRQLVNRVRQQLHAEDPKAFKAAFDTRRGSVSRLKDMGLMALANLTASSGWLKQIAPATPEFLEDLAGSERHNKALESALRRAEVARKRALAPDREQRTVINPKTGKKRTISSRGLPFVLSTGVSDVQSFINLLDQQKADAEWARDFKGKALGGFIGMAKGGKMRLARDFAGPPLPGFAGDISFEDYDYNPFVDEGSPWSAGGQGSNWMFNKASRGEGLELLVDNLAWLRQGRRTIKSHALGGLIGYALGGFMPGFDRFRSLLKPYFPNAAIALPNTDLQTETLIGEVAGEFSQRYPKSAESLASLRLITTRDLLDDPSLHKAAAATSGFSETTEGRPRIFSQMSFKPWMFEDPAEASIRDYLAMRSGRNAAVPRQFSGIPGIFAHELGHVLDNASWSRVWGFASDVFAAPLASEYAKESLTKSGVRENLAEHFSTYLLGNNPDQNVRDFFLGLSDTERFRDYHGFALGGKPRKNWGGSGAYIVGEQGDEVFVPESAGWIIPHRLMDQLPKRVGGGDVLPPRREEPAPDESEAQKAERKARDQAAWRKWELAQGIGGSPKESRARRRAYTGPYEGDEAPPISGETEEQWKARRAQERKQLRAKRREMDAPFWAEEKARKEQIKAEYVYKGDTENLPGAAAGATTGRPRIPKGQPGGGRWLPNDPGKAFEAGANAIRVRLVDAGGGPVEAGAQGPVTAKDIAPGTRQRAEAEAAEAAAAAEAKAKAARPGVALTPAEKTQVEFATQRQGMEKRIEDVLRRAGVTADVAQASARAAGPQLGQTISTIVGRGGIIARKAVSDVSEQMVRWGEKQITDIDQEINSIRVKIGKAADLGDVDQVQKLTDSLGPLQEQLAAAQEGTDKFRQMAIQASGDVAKGSDKLKVFGSNLVGIAYGSLIYSGVFSAIQMGMSGIIQSVGPLIDELAGFQATSTRVTSSLAEQTKAQHGNTQAVLATAEAEAGLNRVAADRLTSQLQLTAQVKAGALAQAQASDLFRGAAGIGAGAPQGLFGGYGGVFGTPLLAQQLGGGKGFSEIVQGDLSNLSRPQANFDIIDTLGKGLTYVTNPDFRQTIDNLSRQQGNLTPEQGLQQSLPGLPISGALSLVGGVGDWLFRGGKAPPGPAEQEAERQRLAQEPGGLVQTYLGNLNQNIARMGGRARYEFTTDEAQRQQATAAAAAAGDLNGVSAAAQGFIITLDGAVAGVKEYTTAVEQAARGAALPSAEVVTQALARQREITQGVIQAQAARQLSFSLPTQAAMQYYGNQPLAPGVGVVPPAGAQGFGGFQAIDPYASASFGRYEAQAKSAYDNITEYAQRGLDKLRLVPGIDRAQLDQYVSLGDQIRDIQTELANKMAVQSAVQYNHQLYIMNRSLKDAAALVSGRAENEATNLGYLQRQMYTLDRQSTSLSLARSQRQINFQVAVAGFQAPGMTSEARAANIEAAKLEAEYNQKQLNISRRQFVFSGQIFEESALRQLNDAKFALADLVAGHKIEIDAKAAQQTIGLMQADMQNAANQIGVDISKAEQIFSAKVSEAATVAATATGEAFSVIYKAVDEAWSYINRGAYDIYQGILHPETLLPEYTPSIGGTRPELKASGGLFNTAGATPLIVGEAGTETVAILRNPRSIAYTPSGGGGETINFYITGNTIRDDSDIDKIARKVEDIIMRRGAMMSLRPMG